MMKDRWTAHSALVELWIGIMIWGAVFQIPILIFLDRKGFYSLGLWLGVIASLIVAKHMEHTIGKALDAGEAGAVKQMWLGYLVRYFGMAIFLAVLGITGAADVIAAFFGLITLKLSAYIQPLTHKISVAVCGEEAFYREMVSPEEQDEMMKAAKQD